MSFLWEGEQSQADKLSADSVKVQESVLVPAWVSVRELVLASCLASIRVLAWQSVWVLVQVGWCGTGWNVRAVL